MCSSDLALRELGDPEALPAIERAIDSELESRVQRMLRLAAYRLHSGKPGEGEIRKVRRDVEDLRDENRKLRDRLAVLEARLGNGRSIASNGHANGTATPTGNRAATE